MKLNIGSGVWSKEGWTTIDYYNPSDYLIDLRVCHKLPFKSDSVSKIYCSHVLEHLEDPIAIGVVSECYRVLHSGGVARFLVPDIDLAISKFIDLDYEWFGCDKEDYDGLKRVFFGFIASDYSALVVETIMGIDILENLKSMGKWKFIRWCIDRLPKKSTWCHCNAYNDVKLMSFLEWAGFGNVTVSHHGKSSDEEMRDFKYFDAYEKITLHVEAKK